MTHNGKAKRTSPKRASALMRSIDTAVDAALGSEETAARVRRYVAEHDAPADDIIAFRRLCLVVFAQGLNWQAVETKRQALEEAFCGFDPAIVADFDDAKIAQLLTQPIIRNSAKVRACVTNARRWQEICAQDGTYLAHVAKYAAGDLPESGWPGLGSMLYVDFERMGKVAIRQVLKRWGFFTAFAHPGARRVLERLAIVPAGCEPEGVQLAIGAIAAQLGRDPYAVEAVLALFAGVGPCRVKPRCDACQLADRCPAAVLESPTKIAVTPR